MAAEKAQKTAEEAAKIRYYGQYGTCTLLYGNGTYLVWMGIRNFVESSVLDPDPVRFLASFGPIRFGIGIQGLPISIRIYVHLNQM